MNGTTSVPPIWSDIFLFLSVFRVINVSFKVVIILGTETFDMVTGIILFVVLWINGEYLRRCTEQTDVALGKLVFEGLRLGGDWP